MQQRLFGAVLLVLTAAGQGTRNPIGSPTTLPNSSTQPGPTLGTSPSPTEVPRPVFLSGKVVLEDGTPPPDSVALQLMCSGNPHTVGYTNPKGQFNIDLADKTNSIRYSDASQGTGSWNDPSQQGIPANPSQIGTSLPVAVNSQANFIGCELSAVLPGFRSDRVDLFNRQSMDNPEIGTIVLRRLGNVEGLTISATTGMAPKDARKAFEKGRNAEKKGKWDEAENDFQKSVDEYPKFAAAWYELGFAQQKRNNLEAARKSYARSLEADPKFINPYGQLAVLAVRDQKWDEVADQTGRLLQLNPVDFPLDWYYNALANLQLQKLDAAEKSAREGITTDHQHRIPKLNHLLGIILANKKDYPGAMDSLRAYLLSSPPAAEADLAKRQLAEIEKLVQSTPVKD